MDFLNRHLWLKKTWMLLAIFVDAPFAGYLLLSLFIVGAKYAW